MLEAVCPGGGLDACPIRFPVSCSLREDFQPSSQPVPTAGQSPHLTPHDRGVEHLDIWRRSVEPASWRSCGIVLIAVLGGFCFRQKHPQGRRSIDRDQHPRARTYPTSAAPTTPCPRTRSWPAALPSRRCCASARGSGSILRFSTASIWRQSSGWSSVICARYSALSLEVNARFVRPQT